MPCEWGFPSIECDDASCKRDDASCEARVKGCNDLVIRCNGIAVPFNQVVTCHKPAASPRKAPAARPTASPSPPCTLWHAARFSPAESGPRSGVAPERSCPPSTERRPTTAGRV